MHIASFYQCRFGGTARKPTAVMTACSLLHADLADMRCLGGHYHAKTVGARARRVAFIPLPMPNTRRNSAAASRAASRLGARDLAGAQVLAHRLCCGSGRRLAFLLSTLQPRARSDYTKVLQDFSSKLPQYWRSYSSDKKDEWLSEFILESLEETSTPGPMRVLSAAL